MHVADAKRDATRGIQESHTAAALSPDTYLDQKPAGGAVPETNAGMLEHMLGIGVVDCDTPYTATAGTYAGQPDTAEQTQGTRSHPTGAAAGHDRSQISQQSGTAGHRKPQGTSGPRHKQGAKGLNSEKRQQTLARQREYQALYRAKNRVRLVYCTAWPTRSELDPHQRNLVRMVPPHGLIRYIKDEERVCFHDMHVCRIQWHPPSSGSLLAGNL